MSQKVRTRPEGKCEKCGQWKQLVKTSSPTRCNPCYQSEYHEAENEVALSEMRLQPEWQETKRKNIMRAYLAIDQAIDKQSKLLQEDLEAGNEMRASWKSQISSYIKTIMLKPEEVPPPPKGDGGDGPPPVVTEKDVEKVEKALEEDLKAAETPEAGPATEPPPPTPALEGIEKIHKAAEPGPEARAEETASPDVALLPGFLAKGEADALLERIRAEAGFRQNYIKIYGEKAIPRLEAWYGAWDYPYAKGIVLKAAPMPAYLQEVIGKIEKAGFGTYDAVLINRYRNGNDCISPHSDDDYGDPEPTIPTLTLGAARPFRMARKAGRKLDGSTTVEYLPSHGDLLVMRGRANADWQHWVPKTAKPVGERVSLTFRRKPPVLAESGKAEAKRLRKARNQKNYVERQKAADKLVKLLGDGSYDCLGCGRKFTGADAAEKAREHVMKDHKPLELDRMRKPS
jgi:alkylated DNA repair dioxygenase AlkB